MMDLLATSVPPYDVHVNLGEVDASRDDTPVMETPPAAPSSMLAREVQARLAVLFAEVELGERHLRVVIAEVRGGQ